MIELSDENLADLKAMQAYCFKKSTQYQGSAGADFAVMAQYLGWFIEELNGNQDTQDKKPLHNVKSNIV